MKKYLVSTILSRAAELGIVLWISLSEIQADGPPGTLTDRFRETIASHKRELLAVLPATLCAACLDAGEETRAVYMGVDELMCCKRHQIAQGRLSFTGVQ